MSAVVMDTHMVEAARQQAEICKVFASANRILIVWVLANQELSVSDIAQMINASLQNTSQHLRLMKDKGILESRRDGHTVYYHVSDCKLRRICHLLDHATHDPRVAHRR